MKDYGNPQVKILCNAQTIHPIEVIAGEPEYTSFEEIRNVTQ